MFQFNIECDKNVSNIELKELLALSGVKKADGNVIDITNDLKNSSSNSKINISDAKAFFKDSSLIKFDLNQVSSNELMSKISSIGIEQSYYEKISNSYSYQSDKYNSLDDNEVTMLETIVNNAIVAAQIGYNNTNDNTVKTYKDAAEAYQTVAKSKTDKKEKCQQLTLAFLKANGACMKSMLPQLKDVSFWQSYIDKEKYNVAKTAYEAAIEVGKQNGEHGYNISINSYNAAKTAIIGEETDPEKIKDVKNLVGFVAIENSINNFLDPSSTFIDISRYAMMNLSSGSAEAYRNDVTDTNLKAYIEILSKYNNIVDNSEIEESSILSSTYSDGFYFLYISVSDMYKVQNNIECLLSSFNSSTQMSLEETSSTTDDAPANSDGKFRIYETPTLKPTLYFTDEADKKTITFEIPLDFPEYTASEEKIKSFTIQESSKNSILTEKVAESGS